MSCDGKEVFVAMPARALFPTLDEAPRLPEWMLRRGVVAEVSRAVALLSRAPAHACAQDPSEVGRRPRWLERKTAILIKLVSRCNEIRGPLVVVS